MGFSEALKKRGLEIGFDLVGIAPITVWADLEFSRRWVCSGYGGEMRYLANPKRQDPRRILPSVQSVICAGLVYNAALPYSTEIEKTELKKSCALPAPDPGRGIPHAGPPAPWPEARAWISRYAWGRDYHEILRAKLEQLRKEIEAVAPAVETRAYVDTGPVVERAFARYSGIGWMGKNTCLINAGKGSWFFLGVILTNLALEPDLPAPDRCGSCTRCLEACPTGALTQPYVMDASRCIAYFTIELQGPIPVKFRPAMGRHIFGCDICQDVCPWNSPHAGEPGALEALSSRRKAATTERSEFQPLEIEVAGSTSEFHSSEALRHLHGGDLHGDVRRPDNQCLPELRATPATGGVEKARRAPRLSLFDPPLRALASISEEGFQQSFSHSPLKRARYRGWLRNLCVAMGNSGDRGFIPWLENAARHPEPLISEHAAWALERLRKTGCTT